MILSSCNTLNFSPKEWEANKTIPGSYGGKMSQTVKDIVVTSDEKAVRRGTSLRVKEMLRKVEMSASSYDTAWVAMVPSMEYSGNRPLYPESLKWIMENQQPNGSWCLDSVHPSSIKDSLSSTLASVLALRRWNVAHQLIHKGLDYIGSNIWAATDKDQYSPIGFDAIFPSMIEYAHNLGLKLSLNSSLLDSMLQKRQLETTSLKGKGSNLAYVAEGLMNQSDINWDDIMKHQRRNGSILNSPASTAAALIHLQDAKCLQYLHSLMAKFKTAVPTVYPFDIYARLSIIDELQKLGIDRHANNEITMALDDIYRCWLEGNEEIVSDPTCCALAFRLLRSNNYVVSADVLENFTEEHNLSYNTTKCALELFKASQLTIFRNEPILDRIYDWTSSYLKQELLDGSISDKSLQNEVDYAVKHPYATLKRMENKTHIEHYDKENVSLLKTSYRFLNVDRSSLLAFSVQDFNKSQSQFHKELAYLAGWEERYRLNELKYARQRLEMVYFCIVTNLFEPKYCDARLAWTQHTILTTVVDDFFDIGGSMEELLNLINLIERWDAPTPDEFMSKDVEILFYAIYDLVNNDAEKAKKYQGRCIKRHLIDIWIDILKAMFKESEYVRYNIVPTVDEYTSNGCKSISFGAIVLIPLYFLGKMSEEVVESEEYRNLHMHISMLGRLMNDRVTAKKDMAEGKLNSISLRVLHGKGAITEKEADEEVGRIIEKHKRELLRMVLKNEGSEVPRECKDLFWMTSKELHFVYKTEDSFTSPRKMIRVVNEIINEPILVP